MRLLPVPASERATTEFVQSSVRWVRQFAASVRGGSAVLDRPAIAAAAVLRDIAAEEQRLDATSVHN